MARHSISHHPPRARAHRSVRALRLLPARLPDLRAVGQRNGFAARPHLPDEDGQRRRDRDDRSQWVEHFDTCLGCMSCMTACPSGVDYAKLIEATRAQIERRHPRSIFERLHRWMIFNTFPRVDRLRLLRASAACLSEVRVAGVGSRIRIAEAAPQAVSGAMEALMPKLGTRREIAGCDSRARSQAQTRRLAAGLRPARISCRRSTRLPCACWQPKAAR